MAAEGGDQPPLQAARKCRILECSPAQINGQELVPYERSGHRLFIGKDDELYLIGGFCCIGEDGVILNQCWRLNLLTKRWSIVALPEDFSTQLASFSCCPRGSNNFVIFGGTGVPFGNNLHSRVYFCSIEGDDILAEVVEPIADLPGVYGHCMVYHEEEDCYYVIGGTNGRAFKLDVYKLFQTTDSEGKKTWKLKSVLFSPEAGMYRMEVTVDKHLAFLFGGGTPTNVKSLDELYVFNMKNHNYEMMRTSQDPKYGYPTPRRCHSLARSGRIVYISGGYGGEEDAGEENYKILSDIWSIDLDTFTWKYVGELAEAVFFHDSAITKDGMLVVFGGVTHFSEDESIRTNNVQVMQMQPSSLFASALEKVNRQLPATIGLQQSTKDSIMRQVVAEYQHLAGA